MSVKQIEQLSLFEIPKEESVRIWETIIENKESQRATQRRLFAELRELKSRVNELQAEVERLKSQNVVTVKLA